MKCADNFRGTCEQMRQLRRQIFLFSLCIAIVAAGIFISRRVGSDPLRKSKMEIRAWLLGITPLGTSSNEVRTITTERGWYTDGFETTLPRPARDPFIGGNVGGYQGLPWYTFVDAFWEFDSSNRLTDIRVRKMLDSP